MQDTKDNKAWPQRAVMIAVGTEVTSGQIKNSHGTFIASQLDDYGLEPILHLAVPDDEALMIESFQIAAKAGANLFITGGLGPTRDDFTREVVAKWLGLELEFHEPSWVELQDRLNQRKVSVSPNHKRQCFYPKGSVILRNEVGTAHGFYIESKSLRVWILPGPTAELHNIWTHQVKPQLAGLGSTRKFHLLKWKCLGLPESEVADLVEKAVEGSGLQTGYRLTAPFVEAKIWIPIDWTEAQMSPWVARLESAIGASVILRDDSDQAFDFLSAVGDHSIIFVDRVTGGQASERLFQVYREHKKKLKCQLSVLSVNAGFDSSQMDSDFVVELSPSRSGGSGQKWDLEFRNTQGSTTYSLVFESKARTSPDKLGRVAVELALQKLLQEFGKSGSSIH